MSFDALAYYRETPLATWLQTWLPQRDEMLAKNGNAPQWRAMIEALPELEAQQLELNRPTITIGEAAAITAEQRQAVEQSLWALRPWRKGPFEVLGTTIDSEWRSDWKWQRLQPHLPALQGKQVLDVGCGNGYYALRMLGAGAASVIGIDPSALFNFQFQALTRFGPPLPVTLLPLRAEQLPADVAFFDLVFSMGVLYHRRYPLDHLAELRHCLRGGGVLVLETLVIPGEADQVLVPRDRYAQMRNVWSIPTAATLLGWLERCGFNNPQVVTSTVTTVAEQRRTPWMPFQSLADFLHPDDSTLTREGYPAPQRAILLAER